MVADVALETIHERVRRTTGPQFRLPKRFETATFANYRPDRAFPVQSAAVDRIRELISAPEPSRSRSWLPWRRPEPTSAPRGIYLDGPPGIGKTHLLAAAFRDGAEPKLFVTFDELSAAAGTLGMDRLRALLANQRLVCIDEIDLRDPANIMLLTSLVRAMLEGRPRILATANADPATMPNAGTLAADFARELGEIADSFEVLTLDGVDWREAGLAGERTAALPTPDPRVLTIGWDELQRLLGDVHPMYDAAWLDEVDCIALDRLAPLSNTDRALRFVRLIDRVYDRDVGLQIDRADHAIEDVLQPVRDDRRFTLHYIRCRSRLIELTSEAALEAI